MAAKNIPSFEIKFCDSEYSAQSFFEEEDVTEESVQVVNVVIPDSETQSLTHEHDAASLIFDPRKF